MTERCGLPIAIVHSGFLRAEAIRPFGDALKARGFEVHFKHLPGHRSEPLISPITAAALASELRAWIVGTFDGRRTIVIGESLGGLAAMGLARDPPPGLQKIFAADPPLTMLKQGALHALYRRPREDIDALRVAYADLLGVQIEPDRIYAIERDYRDFLIGARVPIHLIAGGRTVSGATPPSVIDEADRILARASADVTLHEMSPDSGHLVLVEDRDAVAELVARCAPRLRR